MLEVVRDDDTLSLFTKRQGGRCFISELPLLRFGAPTNVSRSGDVSAYEGAFNAFWSLIKSPTVLGGLLILRVGAAALIYTFPLRPLAMLIGIVVAVIQKGRSYNFRCDLG